MTGSTKSRFLIAVFAALLCAYFYFYQRSYHKNFDLVKIVAGPSYNDPTTVTLRVPNEIRYGSAVGAASSNYFNIIANGALFDKETDSKQVLPNLDCNGYCDKKVLISLSIIPESWVGVRAQRYYDDGAGAGLIEHKPIWAQTSVVDRTPEFGFNKVFDVIKPASPQGDITRFFVRNDRDYKPSDVVVGYCYLSTPFHNCMFSYVLSCEPRLNIDITGWPYERLENFAALKRKVDLFIESMIVAGQCDNGRYR